ncbi:LytTR family transcriptional regulator [Sphaerisporangium rufum]|uniref:LytTR family transcriptional regulator n=1 Tax=Sphaerisporangium rufum TaxID=1381558 RepID=A0A919V8H8_9ACTN|nr:LCP family protein [Sphaerisporangium rufum]GII81360.1 LytTR family transcriptional regulator [Sphaerisporangium rufum]
MTDEKSRILGDLDAPRGTAEDGPDGAGPDRPATPPGRPPRRRRPFRRLMIVIGLLVAMVLATGFAVVMERQITLNGNIERIPGAFPDGAGRPAVGADGAQNWLLIGSDRRPGESGGQRADSIMIVHVPAARDRLTLIGIPRDSYVRIPGRGNNKINAAYAFGGPKLLISTVEQLTGVRIDHFAALDFQGFVTMTQVIGGVDVELAQQVYDPANKVTWPKGTVHLEGERALLFVRQRYNLPGGDFDRMRRQQAFVRALGKKIISEETLTNPFRLNDFLEAFTRAVSVDSGVTMSTLRDLALELRDVRPDKIDSTTIPTRGTAMVKGASVVRVDRKAGKALFDAVRADTLPDYFTKNGGLADLEIR